MMEKPEDILRKFKKAVTDSDTEHCVRFDPEDKPGVVQPDADLLRRHRQDL